MGIDFKSLSKVADSMYSHGKSKVADIKKDMRVSNTHNPLDMIDVRTKDCSKTKHIDKTRYVVLDHATAKNFRSKDRQSQRRFLSRLTDSERRKFLQMVKDAEENERRGDDLLDLQVFPVLLSNAVNSQSASDLELLNDFVSNRNLPSACQTLTEKVLSDDIDFDTDYNLIQSVCDIVGDEDNSLMSSFKTVYSLDEEGDSQIDVTFDEEIGDSVDNIDDEMEYLENEADADMDDFTEFENENDEDEEITDSVTDKVIDSNIIEIITKGGYKKGNDLRTTFNRVFDSVTRQYSNIDVKRLTLEILRVFDSLKVSDNFADKISESLTEAIDNEVGDISLVDLLNEALTAFAEGDSEPLTKFVNATTVSEVGDLLAEEGNGSEESEHISIEEDKDGDEDVDVMSEDEQTYTEESDGDDITINEFNPTRREDCVKVAKLVLNHKLTRQINDSLSEHIQALKDNVLYDDDERVERDIEPSVDTVILPMSNEEYTSLNIEKDVPKIVNEECGFNCPTLTEEPTVEGGVIILNTNGNPLSVIPFDMTTDEVIDSMKDMDLNAKRTFLTEHTVKVSDCNRYASKHNAIPFIDNRFYKSRITDSFWSINGEPKCLGDNKGTRLYPKWCDVKGEFTEVNIYGQTYKLV